MRVPPAPGPLAGWSALLTQTVGRMGAHQSSPTLRPVPPPDPVASDIPARRPSRHTFDIRV